MPFFSIIVPTYNRPDAVMQLIGIIITQRFADWELIIVDDSKKSMQSRIEGYGDNRIVYHHRGIKSGVSLARNVGAAKAGGRYLVFIDDDDRVTENWLKDFATLAEANQYPEVLFCGMEIDDTHTGKKEVYLPSDGANLWRFIFPGSWAIRKDFFDQLGGYDERLLFGENTELFFRIRAAEPRQAMTDAVNFFYYPSVDGGSKNIRNKIESTRIVLEKHKDYFEKNRRVERLLVQVMGVSFLRLNRFKEARKCLLKAYLLNPFDIKTLVRLSLAYLPFVSKKIFQSS